MTRQNFIDLLIKIAGTGSWRVKKRWFWPDVFSCEDDGNLFSFEVYLRYYGYSFREFRYNNKKIIFLTHDEKYKIGEKMLHNFYLEEEKKHQRDLEETFKKFKSE